MLSIQTFGRIEISWLNQTIGPKGKPLALLLLVALHPEGLPRAQATQMLWGTEGRNNLRQALYLLRQLPGAEHWAQMLNEGEILRVQAQLDLENPSLAQLRLPFLPGLPTNLPEDFMEWLELERRKLEEQRREGLWRAAQVQPEEALGFLDELLGIDPLNESALREVMRLEALAGRPETALRRFEQLRRALKEELGLQPLGATLELAEAIKTGQPAPVQPSLNPLAQRLSRAMSLLELEANADFWAEVLGEEAFEVAETQAQLSLWPASLLIPKAVAKLLHKRIAQALERHYPEQAFLIARQWLWAGEPEAALEWLLKAGQAGLNTNLLEAARQAFFLTLWAGAQAGQRRSALIGLSQIGEAKNELDLLGSVCAELGQLAKATQDDLTYFEFHFRSAVERIRRGQPQAALEQAEEAAQVGRRLERHDLLHQAMLTLGAAQMAVGQLAQAETALGLAAQSDNNLIRLRALGNLGGVYGMQGRLEDSLAHLEQALTLARDQGNLGIISNLLHNLSATAERLGRYERAIEGFREALEVGRRIPDPRTEATAYRNLAFIYVLQGRLGPAWNTLTEALELASAVHPSLHAQTLCLLGELAGYLGQPELAQRHLQEALWLANEVQDKRALFNAQIGLAELEVQPNLLELLEVAESQGLRDLAHNARLNQLLVSTRPSDLEALLERVQLHTPYSRLVGAIGQARLLHLYGQPIEVLSLQTLLEQQTFKVTPLGYHWLALSFEASGRSSDFTRALKQAALIQKQQAEGLPKALQQSFLEQKISVQVGD